MSDSPVPPDLDPTRGEVDDPMSADRRVLVIGAAAMVVLILVGFVAAAVFTRSACGGIEPDPQLASTVGSVEDVLADGLGDLFDDEREALAETLRERFGEELGPVRGAVDVTGATHLVPVGGPDSGLVAAVGATTTVFEVGDVAPRDVADVGDGTVVGSGDTLYSLALTNPNTGQTDAIVPLDATLAGGDCLDTATVGTSFAFYLDAGDGELLLFRVEEDGEFPQLERRDARQGQVWITPLDVPEIPPGVTGERLDGALGDDLVVVARRSTADDEAPAVSAFDRATGEPRWTQSHDAVAGAAPGGDAAIWAEVVQVDADLVLLALSRDERRDSVTLAAVDVTDGSLRWHADLEGDVPTAADVAGGELVVVADSGVGVVVRRFAAADGQPQGVAAVDDPDGNGFDGRGATVAAGDGRLVVGGHAWFSLADDAISAVAFGLEGTRVLLADAVTVGGATVVLITSDDGAVAVVYGG